MKKCDLKVNDKVEMRNGDIAYVHNDHQKKGLQRFSFGQYGASFSYTTDWDENLRHIKDCSRDVIKVNDTEVDQNLNLIVTYKGSEMSKMYETKIKVLSVTHFKDEGYSHIAIREPGLEDEIYIRYFNGSWMSVKMYSPQWENLENAYSDFCEEEYNKYKN